MTKEEKLNRWIKYAETWIGKFEFSVMLISFVLAALFKDLGFDNAYRVSNAILLWSFIPFLLSCILLIVAVILKSLWKHEEKKKSNIEKLIDEEIDKGEKNK